MPNAPFTSNNPGQDTGSLVGGLLEPNGGDLVLQSGAALPSVIQGIDRIFVTEGFETTNPSGDDYQFTINVFGGAPYLGKVIVLTFQDQSPDTYTLSIVDPIAINHTVEYNSEQPGIVVVSWTMQDIVKESEARAPSGSGAA